MCVESMLSRAGCRESVPGPRRFTLAEFGEGCGGAGAGMVCARLGPQHGAHSLFLWLPWQGKEGMGCLCAYLKPNCHGPEASQRAGDIALSWAHSPPSTAALCSLTLSIEVSKSRGAVFLRTSEGNSAVIFPWHFYFLLHLLCEGDIKTLFCLLRTFSIISEWFWAEGNKYSISNSSKTPKTLSENL